MTSLLYILNVICSSGQSALGKQYAKKGGTALPFNLNKTIAGFVLFALWGILQGFTFHLPTVWFGIAYGVSLSISMHTGFKALATGPMALTSIIASFSLLIPFFFGVFFWNESLTLFGVCGILLLLISIVLINCKKVDKISYKWLLYALATLLTNGICSVIQKYHQLQFPKLYRTEFMVFALFSTLIILSITIGFDNTKHQGKKFSVLGIISGVLNCLSNYIVLYLSATENASVLFPIVSIANITTVWLIGVIFFKEKLTLLQTIGLLLGVASIVLLKI